FEFTRAHDASLKQNAQRRLGVLVFVPAYLRADFLVAFLAAVFFMLALRTPVNRSVLLGSLCVPPLLTCLSLMTAPFLITCTSAMAWPRPRSKSSLSQATISPALVSAPNPL